MITPSSPRLFPLAQRLVERARRGELPAHKADLFRYVRSDPRRATELLIVLAELLASDRPPLLDEERRQRLRAAHSAYERGVRHPDLIEGEREYQREKKRMTRWRTRGAVDGRSKGAA
jgi:hypothetical protein